MLCDDHYMAYCIASYILFYIECILTWRSYLLNATIKVRMIRLVIITLLIAAMSSCFPKSLLVGDSSRMLGGQPTFRCGGSLHLACGSVLLCTLHFVCTSTPFKVRNWSSSSIIVRHFYPTCFGIFLRSDIHFLCCMLQTDWCKKLCAFA